jgi:hypothetical protein
MKTKAGRLNTHREQILSLLRSRGARGALTSELKEIGNQYTARISELTSVGYIIDATKVSDGQWKYVLSYEPEEEKEKKSAPDQLKDTLNQFGYNGEFILSLIEKSGLIVKYQNGKVKQQALKKKMGGIA